MKMTKQDLKEAAMKKEIGLRFKQFREFINKSQAKLAKELQVRQVIISEIETGRTFPGLNLQYYLNGQYHLNINWLIHGSGEMIEPPWKKSKHLDLHQLLSQIDKNDPRYEKVVELLNLLRIPVIKTIIFAKLEEIKVLAAKEIDSFFEK
jgi:transcriptional regulator with XRE-family HTH domain